MTVKKKENKSTTIQKRGLKKKIPQKIKKWIKYKKVTTKILPPKKREKKRKTSKIHVIYKNRSNFMENNERKKTIKQRLLLISVNHSKPWTCTSLSLSSLGVATVGHLFYRLCTMFLKRLHAVFPFSYNPVLSFEIGRGWGGLYIISLFCFVFLINVKLEFWCFYCRLYISRKYNPNKYYLSKIHVILYYPSKIY